MEDSIIIEQFWQRDEAAIENTRQKYGGYCYSIAYNILCDPLDSEEAVNDTYLGVWNAIPPHKPDIFSSFIARITRNISLKKWRYKHTEKRSCDLTSALEELGECIPSSEDVEQTIQTKDLARHIDSFLRTLSEKDRIVFLRRYWFCDSVCAIAERFGASEGKIKMQLYRTRQKLREYFEKEGINV